MRTILSATLLVALCSTQQLKSQNIFEFSNLPYSYNALEVFIDKETMDVHFNRHHRAYYTNFIKALNDNGLEGRSITELFTTVSSLPVSIRNNGGGYYNHNLFWQVMSPDGGGEPIGTIKKAIDLTYGSFANFRFEFETAANTRFGSGWAWLCVDSTGNLFITSTPNQDNPLMDIADKKGVPVLALDVWEHAYYLKYQNKRTDYTANFWKVVNWRKVEELYIEAVKSK